MRQRKPKAVHYELLDRNDHPELYKRLDGLVRQFHDDLRDANIAVAWCTSWKADVDGHVKLGQCKRATDLDRELTIFDFVILLQKAFWQDTSVTTIQRDALLDHELCHAAVAHDKSGEPLRDERDRLVYRLRRHDLEEFSQIAERYGTWKRDLETFARALKRAPQVRLPIDEPVAP
jgi:hypothetical protein